MHIRNYFVETKKKLAKVVSYVCLLCWWFLPLDCLVINQTMLIISTRNDTCLVQLLGLWSFRSLETVTKSIGGIADPPKHLLFGW